MSQISTDNQQQPQQQPPIHIQTLIDFLTQALCGTIIALKRCGIEQTTTNYKGVVRAQFANYLNMCWISLLKQDDNYVIDTFTKINHKSPICLIHAMMFIGNQILPEEPILIGSSSKVPNLDLTRNLISEICRNALQQMDLEELLGHECSGKSLEEEREEWLEKGAREDDVIFILK
ncbi:hypothetical protein ABK040_001368 [Willaertia magna]